MSLWDDPDVKTNDDFVKFEKVGDTVAGEITSIRKHTFDDGKVAPQVQIVTDDGDEKTLTVGQIRLKALFVEQRPEVGDHITVTLTQIEKRSGGKTLKHFDLKVRRGGGRTDEPPF